MVKNRICSILPLPQTHDISHPQLPKETESPTPTQVFFNYCSNWKSNCEGPRKSKDEKKLIIHTWYLMSKGPVYDVQTIETRIPLR